MYNPRIAHDPLNEMYNPLLDQWEPLRRQARNGANAFFAIAALSLVNSYFMMKGIRIRFIAGLGITQIIDAIGSILATDIGISGHVVAIIVNLLPAGMFGLFGLFARKYRCWSFVIGMVLYAIDGLFLLFFRDFLGMGFHAVVLYPLYKGWQAASALQRIRHTIPPQSSIPEEMNENGAETVERENGDVTGEDSIT